MRFTERDASEIVRKLNLKGISPYTLAQGMNVEYEHRGITHGDPMMTARIALDHLKERADYYDLLDKMEKEPGSVFSPGPSTFKSDYNKDFTSTDPAITRLIVEKDGKRAQIDYAVQGYVLLHANRIRVASDISAVFDTFDKLSKGKNIAGCAKILEDAACKQKCTVDYMRLLSFTAWTGYAPWWLPLSDERWKAVNQYIRFDRHGLYRFNIQMASGHTPLEWDKAPKKPSKLLNPQLIDWKML